MNMLLSLMVSNRTQTVHIRGHFSHPVKAISGVPQGSVTGPLLFILYVNEISKLVQGTAKHYAENEKIKITNKDSRQKDLYIFSKWCSQWLLRFN